MKLICQGCGYPYELTKWYFKQKLKSRTLRCPVCGNGKFKKKRIVGKTKGEKNEMWKKYLSIEYPSLRKFDEDKAKEFMKVKEKYENDKKNRKFVKWARRVI